MLEGANGIIANHRRRMSESQVSMYTTIVSVANAAKLIALGECSVFDCSFDLTDPDKGGALYAAGHVPGARYLHLDDDLAGPSTGFNGRHPLPDPQILAEKLRKAGLNSTDQVITYDNAGGPFAARLWWLMRWLGHDKVAVMDGGVAAWDALGNKVEEGMHAAEQTGDFAPSDVHQRWIVDADMVLDNLSSGAALVLDARSAPRFSGEVLVMDAVAGHIPGARNRPFMENLTAEGRLKSPEMLRDEFEEAMDGFAPAEVVLQCGSGVTACHNALAMHHAGLVGARLYPGSWSEWVSDPFRPVELGASGSMSG